MISIVSRWVALLLPIRFNVIAPAVGAAMVTAGANIFGKIADLFGDDTPSYGQQLRQQADIQKELYDYQYNKNTVKAQMNQYKEASVNPATFLGQGTLSTASAGMPSAPSADPNTSVNQKLMYAQMANMVADVALKNAQAKKTNEETRGQQISNDVDEFRKQFLPMVVNNELDLQELDKFLKGSQLANDVVNRRKTIEETAYVRHQQKIAEKQVEEFVEKIRKAKYEADIAEYRNKFTPQYVEKELESLQGDIETKRWTANQLHALVNNINADTAIKDVQKQLDTIALGYADRVESAKAREAESNADVASYNVGTAVNTNAMSTMQEKRMREGQSTAEYLAPVGEFFGAVGNLISGAKSFIR